MVQKLRTRQFDLHAENAALYNNNNKIIINDFVSAQSIVP